MIGHLRVMTFYQGNYKEKVKLGLLTVPEKRRGG